jgi:N-carbamoyl-L-amino-acid hydrolase
VQSNAERVRRIEAGDLTVVGVNAYSETAPSPLADSLDGEANILVVDESVERDEIEQLDAWRAARDGDSVGTIGMLQVPNGSINVVPGRCQFSLDIRATTDPVRDACASDVLAELRAICARRGVDYRLEETMRAAAAPSDAAWQRRWEAAVEATGLPVHRMPSGAGHDAMKLHEVMPQAMLFVRGENAGISHNPLESSTADDMQLGVDALRQLLEALAHDMDTQAIGAT